jgi:hypothetical protein
MIEPVTIEAHARESLVMPRCLHAPVVAVLILCAYIFLITSAHRGPRMHCLLGTGVDSHE